MQRNHAVLSFLVTIALFFAFLTTAFAQSGVTGKPFDVPNLFPGDSVTEAYTVTVQHKEPLSLAFGIDFSEDEYPLAEVLHIHVTLDDGAITLYDGSAKDFPAAGVTVTLPEGKSKALYTVTATLPTSAGNEYMNRALTVDLLWWYEQEAAPSQPPKVDSADTGDRFSMQGRYFL